MAQYCWAHLIRDIRFLTQHPDRKTRVWAEQLLDRSRRLFQAWHSRDEMSKSGFRRSMIIHRDRFLEIVRNPPDSKEASNLAARFAIIDVTDGSTYDMSQDYFRFLFADGLEPTNNHSEQQIRFCVIDRRITQGTRSEAGQLLPAKNRTKTSSISCKPRSSPTCESNLHQASSPKVSVNGYLYSHTTDTSASPGDHRRHP